MITSRVKSESKVRAKTVRILQILMLSIFLEEDQALNPLKGINVDAAGGASKVLRMVAEKVSTSCLYLIVLD